jgi:hypothetical protein
MAGSSKKHAQDVGRHQETEFTPRKQKMRREGGRTSAQTTDEGRRTIGPNELALKRTGAQANWRSSELALKR